MRAVPAILALLLATGVGAGELTKEDEALLGGLLGKLVFDPPKDARRVALSVTVRSCWGSSGEAEREGWLIPAAGDQPTQVVFTDGRAIPAPPRDQLRSVDLVAATKARLALVQGESEEDHWRRSSRARMEGAQEESPLALAAWLYRLGEKELAAGMLAEARKGLREEGKLEEALASELAWECFAGMVHAYMVRADEEALEWGKRLLGRHAEQAGQYSQAALVVAELERRKAKGTFGKDPGPGWPEGFEQLAPEQRAAWLVDALEEVDARQFGQPGGVDLSSDRRVEALIQLGEVAVPALIDAVEKDARLTRSVHFWRDFSRDRTVLAVREAALTAVMSILRVQLFEPGSTGDNFTKGGGAEVAKRLREYWDKNKGRSLEQRMLAALVDPETKPEQLREAGQNLAELGGQRRIGTTVWGTRSEPAPAGTPNPALKLEKPTAAEAMLAAMERDLAGLVNGQWKEDARMQLYERRNVERHWLECLIALGDKRVLGVAQKRAGEASEMRLRRQWALLCHALGDPAPMEAFLLAFRKGELALPPVAGQDGNLSDEPGAVELRECVQTFLRLGSPASADAALRATAASAHPYHAAFARVIDGAGGGFDDRVLFAHPYYLTFLRGDLDSTEATGTTWKIEDGQLVEKTATGSSSQGLAEPLDPAIYETSHAERRCDRAAGRLAAAVIGFPEFHPLMRDRDERLAELRGLADRFLAGARQPTPSEARAIGSERAPWDVRFIPGIEPLGRAASAEDVAAGKAIFALGPGAKPLELKLPATGRLKANGAPVLVVQAEESAEGAKRYGVIAPDRIADVGPDELEAIEPFPDAAGQAAAARKLLQLIAAGKSPEVLAMLGPEVQAQVEQFGGIETFVKEVKEALAQAGEERLVEMISHGFRAGPDGTWRLERLR